MDRLLLVGGGAETFDEGPEGREGPIDGLGTAGLFGGGVGRSLTTGEVVASMGLAPLRCGTSLDIVSIPECTALGGPFRDPAERTPTP